MDGGAAGAADQETVEERRTRRCGATENASLQKAKLAAITIAVAASRGAIPLCPNIIILIIMLSLFFLAPFAPITEQNDGARDVICLLALTTTQKIADRSRSFRRFKEWMMHIPRVTKRSDHAGMPMEDFSPAPADHDEIMVPRLTDGTGIRITLER